MRKFLLTLLSMICLTAVSFAAEQTATITFKSGTNATQDTPKLNTSSDLANVVEEGTEFFSGIETATNAYLGKVGKGLKLGTGSANGTFELTFAQPIKITSIVANMASYNIKDESSVTINGVQNALNVDDTEFRDYTFVYTSEEEATKLSIATDVKRVYVKSLTITYDDGQQAEVSYTAPSGKSYANNYLTAITSTGAVENLNVTADTHPGIYNVVEGLKTFPGGSFDLNLVAFAHGPRQESGTAKYEDIRYTHTFIFTDYDGDGQWEYVKKIGQKSPAANVLANYDTNMNITETFTLPETVEVGQKARIRVVYTNAWVNLGDSESNPDPNATNLDKGICYDFVIEAVEAPAPTYAVTVEANGTTVEFRNGEEVITDLTAIEEGTVLTFTVTNVPEGKVIESVTAGTETLEATEGVYTLTVTDNVTVTVTLADAPAVANMAATMITRGSRYSGTDSRMEISEQIYLTREGGSWYQTGENDSFTLAGWFRLNAKTSLPGGTMIMGLTPKAHNNINGALAIGLDTNGNYKLICGDGDHGNRTAVEGSSSTEMTTGEWHYLTLTYDAATLKVAMYADGKKLKEGTLATNLYLFPDNPGIISLGAAQFDGAIDEFQFWGRALAANEVLAAMADANTVEGLKGFYDFNVGENGQFANAIEAYNFPAQYYTTSGATSSDGGTISVTNTAATPSMTEGRSEVVVPQPTTYALTVEANGATVTFMNGETEVTDLTAIEEGTVLTFTVAAPEGKVVESVKVGEEELTATEGVYTITVDADMTITVTLADAVVEVEYTAPSGQSYSKNYLTSITSTGAVENLNVTADTHPGIYNVIEGLKTFPGSSFDLNLVAFADGPRQESGTAQYEDIRYTHTFIFTDYDGDGQWEYVKKIGQKSPAANVLANYDTNMNITETFTLPETVEVGQKARIRVVYTNAWVDLGSSATDPDPNATNLDKGICYDFVIEAVEAPAPVTHAVTVEANGATVEFKNGEEVITDLTAIEEGTVLTFTVAAPEGKTVESVKVGENELTATEGVYTITVDADMTITVTLADAAPVANMAVTLDGRTSELIDDRIEIAQELYLTRTYGNDEWHTTGADDSFTMSGWFKRTKGAGYVGATVLMGLQPKAHNNPNGSLIMTVPANNKFRLVCGDGATSNNTAVTVTADNSMALNEWYYLTMSYNAATLEVAIYANGELIQKNTLASALRLFPDNPGIIVVGGSQFAGLVDEFQFWGRALTDDEVKAAMTDARAVEGLKGFYDFNTGNAGAYTNAIAEYNYPAQYYKSYYGTSSSDGGITGVYENAATPSEGEGRPMSVTPQPTTYAVTVEANGATVEFRNGETVVTAEELAAIEEGTELTFTVTAPEGKVVESVKVGEETLTASEEGVYTITVDADKTIVVTLADEIVGVEYTAPSGQSYANNYLTAITSTGAVENLNVTADTHPGIFNVVEGLKTFPGSSFDLNLVAFAAGPRQESGTAQYEDIRYTHTFIFTDYDSDGQWEYVKKIGQKSPAANVLANYDTNMNITETFTLPETVEVGQKARIRVVYTNAWVDLGSSATDPDPNATNLDKGICYDFVIEAVEAPAYAVTVEANGATVEFKKGEEVIEDLSAITAGTELSFTVAAPEYTEVASVTANEVELTATEGVYTFTVTAPTTIVVTLNELERPNMAVSMPGRTSNTADNRIEISEKLYLTRTSSDWFTTGENDSFTMAGWFKLDGIQTQWPKGNLFMGLCARAHNNPNASLGVGLTATGKYQIYCGDGSNNTDIAGEIDKEMTANEWHYVTITYDAATREMTFYADGEILKKATFGSALRLFPDDPGIISLGGSQFKGAVDEFQFWGRALSGNEIRLAMVDATEISDGLKGLYDFNAGTHGSYANAIADYDFPAKYYTTVGTSNYSDGGIISVSPIAATPEATDGRVLADVVAPTVYAVSFQMPEGTTVDAQVNGKAMIDPEQVIAGSTLTFTVSTPADKDVESVEINAATVTATNGVYTATVDTDLDVIIKLQDASSIFTIGIDGAEGEIEVFNLNGVRVDADNIVPGIYIVRQGGMTQKVLVK